MGVGVDGPSDVAGVAGAAPPLPTHARPFLEQARRPLLEEAPGARVGPEIRPVAAPLGHGEDVEVALATRPPVAGGVAVADAAVRVSPSNAARVVALGAGAPDDGTAPARGRHGRVLGAADDGPGAVSVADADWGGRGSRGRRGKKGGQGGGRFKVI